MTKELNNTMTDKQLDEHDPIQDPKIDESADEQKPLTQSDIDRIIGDRLKREREKAEKDKVTALELQKAELTDEIEEERKKLEQEKNRLACSRYLLDNNLPSDLLEVIPTDNVEEFIQKADKTLEVFERQQKRFIPPLADTEYRGGSYDADIESAFARTERKPKNKF